MPGNFKVEDIRIQRTNGALIDALTKLLISRNFNQITVNDLCEEAQIARTTFYAHFLDKYDLLENWLMKVKLMIIAKHTVNIEKRISDFVYNNGKIIKHMIEGANSETLGLICDFMLSLLDMERFENGETNLKHAVLARFCCGGIMSYLEWQSADNSSSDSQPLDSYLYEILGILVHWSEN